MCRALSVTLFLAAFLLLPQPCWADSTYRGTVVSDGKPVEGAKVWLSSYHRNKWNDEILIETRTDSQGRFTLAGPKGADVIASALIARASDGRIGWLSLFRNDAEPTELRIELHSVGEARGRLTDAAGKPLPDVRVRVKSFGIRQKGVSAAENWCSIPAPLRSQFETKTGSDGSFVLRGIPVDGLVHASVSAPRFGDPDVFWNQNQSGDFRLERAGRVRIHFTGVADPRKLAGLPLDLFTYPASLREDGRPVANASKSVKAKGQATLDVADVLPGRCNLRWNGDAKVPYVPTQLPEFTVKPGDLTEVTLTLEPAVQVRGRVINRQTKKGVAGVQIQVRSTTADDQYGQRPGGWAWATTDAEGRFAAYVRAGRIGMWMSQVTEGYASSNVQRELVKPVELAGGAEHTFPDITVEPAVQVEGVVVDETGKPVPGVPIRTSEDAMGLRPGWKPIVAGAEGKFVLHGLGAEDVIALRARNERAVTDGGILVTVAEQHGPVRLVLAEKAACRLKGRVVDDRGKPLAGAPVGINWNYRGVGRNANMGYGMGLEGGGKTDAEGRFQTGVLWPGDVYQVTVRAEGYGPAESIRVTGKAGQVHDLGVVLVPRIGGKVQGAVVAEAGQPLSGVKVFSLDAPQSISTVTDKTGRFHLSGLFDGPVFVFARKDGYRITMTHAETGAAEVRIVLLKAGSVQPAEPVDTKSRREAEQKLLWHVLDKGLSLSEAATGGHRRSVFECLARADLAKAQKWLDKEKAAGGRLGANDARRYLRTLRQVQAEQAAASDVDEAISLLSELDAEEACRTLRKLGERFQATEPARGLRFAEEVVVKARTLPLPNRVWHLAAAGDLVVRLGQELAGRKLLKEAEGLAEKLGTQGMQGYARGDAARLLAPYDLSRALLLLQPIKDTNSTNRWLSEMAGHLARADPKAALALVDVLKEDRSTVRQVTRLRIACQAAVHDPAEGARIALGIPDVRYRAEALVHVATAVAQQDRKLAWSLIDKALALYLDQPEAFTSWSNYGGRAVFAAWTAGQAHALGYPDPASSVARALACQPNGHEAHSPAHALETKVRMAKVLALVDPSTARHLLERVVPQQKVLGTSYTGFEKQDWLVARCLADPEHGPALVDEAIAKLDPKNDRTFYQSGLMQLAQVLSAPPERRVRLVMGLNSGILFPNEE